MSIEYPQGNEKLPISEVINVLDYVEIYRTGKWWSAVVLGEQFGRRKVFLYLWCKQGDKWKRKQKTTVSSAKDWDKINEAVRKFLPQLGGAPQSPQ